MYILSQIQTWVFQYINLHNLLGGRRATVGTTTETSLSLGDTLVTDYAVPTSSAIQRPPRLPFGVSLAVTALRIHQPVTSPGLAPAVPQLYLANLLVEISNIIYTSSSQEGDRRASTATSLVACVMYQTHLQIQRKTYWWWQVLGGNKRNYVSIRAANLSHFVSLSGSSLFDSLQRSRLDFQENLNIINTESC